MDGPQLFLRYAFMPNRLQYCGGEDHNALFGYGLDGRTDAGLVELEQEFEGAFPYLQLIARANGVDDPLDARVVEAYWIGNGLLDRVDLRALLVSMEERFRGRTAQRDWPWLASKASSGARPHHSFHVLDVFPRIGLMRDSAAKKMLETIEQCRVRWGRVIKLDGSKLEVEAVPLVLSDGKLRLGAPRPETATRWIDGRGFVDHVREGDWVSLHWGWACDVLAPHQRANLEHYTRLHVAICNQTL